MSESELLTFVTRILFQYFGKDSPIHHINRLNGGCVNESFKITSAAGKFFLKYNQVNFAVQFNKEANSLKILRETNTLYIPEVLLTGTLDNLAFLLMEYIEPTPASRGFWEGFGTQLAELHRNTSPNRAFGLSFDNYIGALPQKNSFKTHWIDFFIENRLEAQVKRALDHQHISVDFLKRFRKLYKELPSILVPEEPPSLIHGDLWSGNFLSGPSGKAVLVDAAIYFGHREIELAFTQLFGGFSPIFYESYQNTWPLQPGFQERVDIYNIYPLLVHVNLFGPPYLSGVEKVMRQYT